MEGRTERRKCCSHQWCPPSRKELYRKGIRSRRIQELYLLDFNKIGKNIKSLFETYLDDLDTFFMYLSSFTNTPLYPRESVIIFDEVQLYPRARTAIKYLVEDGRYDYIETGSLVSIKRTLRIS